MALFNTSLIVISGIALILGRIFIAKKNIEAHKRAMLTATVFAALFLVVYIARWLTFGSTPFEGQGTVRTVYFTILIAHSILAVLVVPFVLKALLAARAEDFETHKKHARKAFPMWLIVAISGWYIYWMLYHYVP